MWKQSNDLRYQAEIGAIELGKEQVMKVIRNL